MNYREIKPSAKLAPYVKCIWILESESNEKNKQLEKILPDACPELIIHYGDLFRINDKTGKIKKQPRSFIFGPLTRHIEIGPSGKTGMIAVRFYPGGLAAFLSMPIKPISNTYRPLTWFFGTRGAKLEKAVCRASTVKERISLLETFLISELKDKPSFNYLLPHATLEKIVHKQDPVKIELLSGQLNLGKRHLERKFNDQIGMTPKLFLRIVRFQNVFKIVHLKKIKNLTDLTYTAGYFDQSHFYRDFKEFAGHSPKEHFKENARLTKLFTSGA